MTAADELGPERVEQAVREVLARAEFHPNALERAFAKLERWLDQVFGVGGLVAGELASAIAFGLLGLVIVAALSAIAYAAWRRSSLGPQGTREEQAALAVEDRVVELRRAARAAEARGELVLALRLHFFAAAVGLGEAGALEYRDAWTNRELCERGRPTRAVRAALAPLVEELDRKVFGGEPVAAEDVRRLERETDALLAAARAEPRP